MDTGGAAWTNWGGQGVVAQSVSTRKVSCNRFEWLVINLEDAADQGQSDLALFGPSPFIDPLHQILHPRHRPFDTLEGIGGDVWFRAYVPFNEQFFHNAQQHYIVRGLEGRHRHGLEPRSQIRQANGPTSGRRSTGYEQGGAGVSPIDQVEEQFLGDAPVCVFHQDRG